MIQSGIYSRVRHPMYLGVILIGASFAGFANSTLAWILEILLMVNLNIKARFEDALLRAEHPESMHYQLHVSRIMPCLGGSCRSNCLYKSGEV
jgi:protein-S-isoprenylcysteine O-methyltransferase Ste14